MAGLALNPGTPFASNALKGFYDLLLCMTVNPGWGGQPYIAGLGRAHRGPREEPARGRSARGRRRDRHRHRARAPRRPARPCSWPARRSSGRPSPARHTARSWRRLGSIPRGGRRQGTFGRRLSASQARSPRRLHRAAGHAGGCRRGPRPRAPARPSERGHRPARPRPRRPSRRVAAAPTGSSIATFATGNPHTDIDFFTQRGNTYVSVGHPRHRPQRRRPGDLPAHQREHRRPARGEGLPVRVLPERPSAATGLQHDVEAAPKGRAILNADVRDADRRDTQILLDATDAPGRCHDQGTLGISGAPQGGLEIIDVTDVDNPQVIGLTSHIGEAHTVNVDPRRPHIAYAVTSDSTGDRRPGPARPTSSPPAARAPSTTSTASRSWTCPRA